MSDDRSDIQLRVYDASYTFHSYIRWAFIKDFMLVIMWTFVFLALTPDGHGLGAVLVFSVPVFLTVYRLGVMAPILFLKRKDIHELRPDKMYKAPSTVRSLAYLSYHQFLYSWSIAGYLSVFVAHFLSALIVVLYSGTHSNSTGITWFFLLYSVAVTVSALATYWTTVNLYERGIQQNVARHLGGQYTREKYATVVAENRVQKSEKAMRAELLKHKKTRPQTRSQKPQDSLLAQLEVNVSM